MKITKSQLKRIIKEELSSVLREQPWADPEEGVPPGISSSSELNPVWEDPELGKCTDKAREVSNLVNPIFNARAGRGTVGDDDIKKYTKAIEEFEKADCLPFLEKRQLMNPEESPYNEKEKFSLSLYPFPHLRPGDSGEQIKIYPGR
tara:strand:+ start:518 stop:958 length:441 start_codon:yes stop_codon:yes gene_type:complete